MTEGPRRCTRFVSGLLEFSLNSVVYGERGEDEGVQGGHAATNDHRDIRGTMDEYVRRRELRRRKRRRRSGVSILSRAPWHVTLDWTTADTLYTRQ